MVVPRRRTSLTEQEVRRDLAALLGRSVRDDIWTDLMERQYMENFLDDGADADDLEDLHQEYLRLDRRYGEKKRRSTAPREVPPDGRLTALSEILAIEAAQDPRVIAYRRDVLGGRLLGREEAVEWIRTENAQQPGGLTRVTVGLPLDTRSLRDFNWLDALCALPAEERARLPVRFGTHTLAYVDPDDTRAHHLPVHWNGPLGKLQALAAALARQYNWEDAWATVFILTGAAPFIPKARMTLTYSSGRPPRVSLDLDPRLSSGEVADLYAEVRREVFHGSDKPMTEKHLRLAVFHAERTGLPWRRMMEEWNRHHHQWRYENLHRFTLDAKAAWCRVTGRKWTPRRGGKVSGEAAPRNR